MARKELKKGGNNKGREGPLNPQPAQQSVLTNALIAEKLNKEGDAKKPAPKKKGPSSTSSSTKGGVIKTVVLPHENVNQLGVEAQKLSNVA